MDDDGNKSEKANWKKGEIDDFNEGVFNFAYNFHRKSGSDPSTPIDLTGIVFPSHFPFDKIRSHWGGIPHIVWNHCTFNNQRDLGKLTFSYDAWFINSVFSTQADFENVTFKGNAHFAEAEFRRGASFDNAVFGDSGKTANFKRARFLGENTTFIHTRFSGSVSFDGGIFEKSLSFFPSILEGSVSFTEKTKFCGEITAFNLSSVKEKSMFNDAIFKGEGRFNALGNHSVFSGAKFKDQATFVGVEAGWADFENTQFFSGSSFF